MKIAVVCPTCNASLQVGESRIGKVSECPACHESFVPAAPNNALARTGSESQGKTRVTDEEMSPPRRAILLERLREGVEQALFEIDTTAKELVAQGYDMLAALCLDRNVAKITGIHRQLVRIHTIVWFRRKELVKLGSKRAQRLGHEPLLTVGDLDRHNDNANAHYLHDLSSHGYLRKHWLVDMLILSEIKYMLDALEILVEPEFFQTEEDMTEGEMRESAEDRYIPPDVKLQVWGRDQGKCSLCGETQHLTYEHIIPIPKGGTNTERNVRLICKDCKVLE